VYIRISNEATAHKFVFWFMPTSLILTWLVKRYVESIWGNPIKSTLTPGSEFRLNVDCR